MLFSSAPTLAATGSWYGGWRYDANGLSSVWSSNASAKSWFQLRLQRGNGAFIATQSVQLGKHQKVSRNMWSKAMVDKRGIVSVSPHVSHVPGWNT